jgi:PIN domain nuclease of toxin-antitoxin system
MKVFDASAVIALLFNEPGAAKAASSLPSSVMSLINVTETIDDFIRRRRPQSEAERALAALGLGYRAPDEEQALIAASLKPIKGLSLADRYCIALARQLAAPVVTADQIWALAPIGVNVELIR